MNTTHPNNALLPPDVQDALRSALCLLAQQLLKFAAADLDDPKNLRALNTVSRVIRETEKTLGITPSLPAKPRKAPQTQPQPQPQSQPASQPNSQPEPALPPSPAAIRKLPGLPAFKRAFFAAWKTQNPGLPPKRINAQFQELLKTLARNPAQAPQILENIQRTNSYTTWQHAAAA